MSQLDSEDSRGCSERGEACRWLAAFVTLAFALRLYKASTYAVIARDGVAYLEQASRFLGPEPWSGLSGYYPPFYALLTALAGAGFGLEVGAVLVSASAGALSLWPLYLLARRSGAGRRASLTTCGVAAVSPALVMAGAEALSDSLALVLSIGALSLLAGSETRRLRLARGASAGLLIGLAALTRPEALMLLPVGLAGLAWRRVGGAERWLFALALTLCCAAIITPYSIALRQRTGRWSVTAKAGVLLGGLAGYAERRGAYVEGLHQHFRVENAAVLGGEPPRAGLADVLAALAARPLLLLEKCATDASRLASKLPGVIHPVVLLLCFWCPWRTLWVRSRALCLASMGHAALVLIIAPRGRYLIPLNPLFLVAFGLAVEEIWRRGAARKWASPTLLLAVVTLSSAPLDLRAERRDKRYVKALAARAASAPSGSVCALSPRVAYYARRRSVTLPRFSDGSEAVRFFERQGVAVVVLRRRWVRRWQPWLPEALIRDGWSVVREAGPERDRRELFVRARAGRPAKQPGR